jgi:hypothetical protein
MQMQHQPGGGRAPGQSGPFYLQACLAVFLSLQGTRTTRHISSRHADAMHTTHPACHTMPHEHTSALVMLCTLLSTAECTLAASEGQHVAAQLACMLAASEGQHEAA